MCKLLLIWEIMRRCSWDKIILFIIQVTCYLRVFHDLINRNRVHLLDKV